MRGLASWGKADLIGKDDRSVLVDDSPVINVVTDTACEGDTFTVTSKAHQVLRFVEVLHAFDFLLDDRAAIELRGNIMTCCSDEFDASFMRLPVWIGANECGQERMVDIDDFTGVFITEPSG